MCLCMCVCVCVCAQIHCRAFFQTQRANTTCHSRALHARAQSIHTLSKYGTVHDCEGHIALVLVSTSQKRPRDPLPVNGRRQREIAVKAIEAFVQTVQGVVPNVSCHLPHSMFRETGRILSEIQSVAHTLSQCMYVRYESSIRHQVKCGVSVDSGSGTQHSNFSVWRGIGKTTCPRKR